MHGTDTGHTRITQLLTATQYGSRLSDLRIGPLRIQDVVLASTWVAELR